MKPAGRGRGGEREGKGGKKYGERMNKSTNPRRSTDLMHIARIIRAS